LTRPASNRGIAATDQSISIARWIERGVLVILLALIPLRVVLNETVTFETPRMFRNLDAPTGAGPATSMAILCIILAAAGLIAFIRLRSGERYRWTGIEIGAAVLAIGMAISTWRAGQKHLALVGSLNFLGILIYAMVLSQLMTRPWRIRLTLAVILATGALLVVKSAQQRFVELPATIKYYEEHKAELLGDRPSDPRSEGLRHDYEQRMKSGAVSGFFSHPNVLGSLLALLIPVGLAVTLANWRASQRVPAVAAGLVTLGMIPTLIGTQSKGACAACAIAIGVMMLGTIGSQWFRRNPRATLAGFWVAALVAAAGLSYTFRVSPDALGRSMLFRSMYWHAAGEMYKETGPLGIGAGNFGRLFTKYKSVECPEEVEDPHSWPIKALLEWGVVGLAGVLLVIGGISWQLARRSRNASEPDTPNSPGGSLILWMAGIGFAAFGWMSAILASGDIGYISLTLGPVMLAWFAAMLAMLWTSDAPRISNAPTGLILAGIIGGMVGFLLHSAVDLALFDVGAGTIFFTVIAVASGIVKVGGYMANPAACKPCATSAAVVAIACAACIALLTWCLVAPLAIVARELRIARTSDQPAIWDAYRASQSHAAYLQAAQAYSLDSAALQELNEELLRRVSRLEHLDVIEPLVLDFQRRDPANGAPWHELATLAYQRYDLGRDVMNLKSAANHTRQTVAAYPTSPDKHLMLADLLEKESSATGSLEARREAANELQTALDLEARRIYVSKPHRMSEAMRNNIVARIANLRK
jgi:hypothetical protein